MTLSIFKLEKLFASSGFLINKYFGMGGICMFIELISIKDGSSFMIYIPSKYEFNLPNGKNVYKIDYLDTQSNDDKVDEYIDSRSDQIEKNYNDIEFIMSPPKKNNLDMTRHLEESYNRPLTLKNLSEHDSCVIKDINRHLNRLKYCIQHIKYSVGIHYKNYIASIRHGEINIYFIKKYQGDDLRKLFIVADLELFYEKIETINNDISVVKEGIYNVLNKNHSSHTNRLKKMIDEKNNFIDSADSIYKKKTEYEFNIQRFEKLLYDINKSEKDMIKKIYKYQERLRDEKTSGIHGDIEKIHIKNALEQELKKITSVKQDIMKNLNILKGELENIFLSTDKILFDNIIMFDLIIKNFKTLSEI